MAERYVLGLDVGSTASKAVVLRGNGEIAGSSVIPAGTGTSGPGRARAGAIQAAGIRPEDIACVTATGYGRNTCEDADRVVSELTCHAIGAHATFPDARTVIDIGGQDAKVLRLGPDGMLEDFVMNDKCAAGTGRFLDVMANILELRVDQLQDEDAKAESTAVISSTCTVFAESEVISQLSRNVSRASLVAGIHASVAARTAGLVRRLGVLEPVIMTGGVAQNGGVVRAIEKELGVKVRVSPLAQLNGAYGAALDALRHCGDV